MERYLVYFGHGYFGCSNGFERANDIEELGEKHIIKKSKFDTSVIIQLKELARKNVNYSIRDLVGELRKSQTHIYKAYLGIY